MTKREREDSETTDAKRVATEETPTKVVCLVVVLKAEQKTITGDDGTSFSPCEAWVRLLFQKQLGECMGKSPTVPVYHKDGKNKTFDRNIPIPSEFTVNTKKSLFSKGQVLLLTGLYGQGSPSKKTGIEYVNYQTISATPILRNGEPLRKMVGGEVEIEDAGEDECVSEDEIRVRIGAQWKLAGSDDASFEERVVLTREFQGEKSIVADFSLQGAIGSTDYDILVRLASVSDLLCLPRVDKKPVSLGERFGDVLGLWRRFLQTVLLQPWGYVGVKGGIDTVASNTRELADVDNRTRQPVCKWPRLWIGEKFSKMLALINFDTLKLDDFKLPKVTLAAPLPPFKMGVRLLAFNDPEKTEAFLFQQRAFLHLFVPVVSDEGWDLHPKLMTELRLLGGDVAKMRDKVTEIGAVGTKGKNVFGSPMLVLFNITESPDDEAHLQKTWEAVRARNYAKDE